MLLLVETFSWFVQQGEQHLALAASIEDGQRAYHGLGVVGSSKRPLSSMVMPAELAQLGQGQDIAPMKPAGVRGKRRKPRASLGDSGLSDIGQGSAHQREHVEHPGDFDELDDRQWHPRGLVLLNLPGLVQRWLIEIGPYGIRHWITPL
jgi:hypothetical protein